jgi:predicted dienelactone hydrolase
MIRSSLAIGLLLASVPTNEASDRSAAGPNNVTPIDGEWKDDTRDRSVRWRCYLPSGSKEPVPVVLFSHGAGGSRETNGMLGRHLASHGIAALHLQHEGSDVRAVRANPLSMKAVHNPQASEPRFRDIDFVVKTLRKSERRDELAGRLDSGKIGMSGHSYGGLTTQVIAGQKVKGYGQRLAIPDLLGAFILSPSPPRPLYGDAETSFDAMFMPMFSATGTSDAAPARDFQPIERRVPFDRSTNVDRWLLVLDGATHFTFSGEEKLSPVARLFPGMDADPNLAANHACLRAGALAFWQATLFGDRNARTYLDQGEFAKFVGQRGTFESKPAKK